jgi:hypothetical protein
VLGAGECGVGSGAAWVVDRSSPSLTRPVEEALFDVHATASMSATAIAHLQTRRPTAIVPSCPLSLTST